MPVELYKEGDVFLCPRCGRKRVYTECSDVRLLAVDGEKVCAVQIENDEFPSTNNAWVECQAHLTVEERLAAFLGTGSSGRMVKRWQARPGLYRVSLQFEWIVREADGETLQQAFLRAFDEVDFYMEATAKRVEVPSDLTRGRRYGAQRRLRSG